MILSLLLAAGIFPAQGAHRETPASVRYADLDLATAQGVAAFDRRVRTAARAACAGEGPDLVDLACMRRFRRDAVRALPAPPRERYLRTARRTSAVADRRG